MGLRPNHPSERPKEDNEEHPPEEAKRGGSQLTDIGLPYREVDRILRSLNEQESHPKEAEGH